MYIAHRSIDRLPAATSSFATVGFSSATNLLPLQSASTPTSYTIHAKAHGTLVVLDNTSTPTIFELAAPSSPPVSATVEPVIIVRGGWPYSWGVTTALVVLFFLFAGSQIYIDIRPS
ncbi:hypothetical protein B0H15DRAFT_1024935 [Mycena belliarum]|uniref:Uncharacterized protein n=1 Tax=Mycena belliarum TaxID=1033014 RepID=A0AAD6XKL1_9AGAR|nr:hypothetical protein B0H15DRAFT_1024935 [Mycena belliae]